MKNLTDFAKESLTKRYQVDEIDLDKFKEIAEKIGNDRDGLGAAVAEIKSHLVSLILSKMFNTSVWSVELQFKSWNDEKPKGPVFDERIEKILAANFNMFTTDELTYLAPKKVPKATVKRWLKDDGYGTVENPMYD